MRSRGGIWAGTRRWWAGIGTLLSLALLAACGGSSPTTATQPPTTTASMPITPTTAPAPKITTITGTGVPTSGPTPAWRKIALPSGFGLQFHVSDVEPAPSNGNVAYACAPVPARPSSQAYAIASTNAGASFGAKARVGSGWGACAQVVVDELRPNRAVAFQDIGQSGYVTSNGGASWQPFTGPYLRSMVTAGATTYGINEDINAPQAGFSLVASDDGLKIWRTLSLPDAASGADIDRVWAQASGGLLIETAGEGAPTQMFDSPEGGASWRRIKTPSGSFYANFVYATVGTNGAWTICGMYNTSNSSGVAVVACTSDSGSSWIVLPQVGDGGQSSPALAGITTGGAVLATDNGSSGSTPTLYRWLPGTTRWQSLGALPPSAASVAYCASAGGGVLWAFVAESDGAGYPGAPNNIYSAPYPAG